MPHIVTVAPRPGSTCLRACFNVGCGASRWPHQVAVPRPVSASGRRPPRVRQPWPRLPRPGRHHEWRDPPMASSREPWDEEVAATARRTAAVAVELERTAPAPAALLYRGASDAVLRCLLTAHVDASPATLTSLALLAVAYRDRARALSAESTVRAPLTPAPAASWVGPWSEDRVTASVMRVMAATLPPLTQPVDDVLAPFPALYALSASVRHGAHLTPDVYLPRACWEQHGTKIMGFGVKREAYTRLGAALTKLGAVLSPTSTASEEEVVAEIHSARTAVAKVRAMLAPIVAAVTEAAEAAASEGAAVVRSRNAAATTMATPAPASTLPSHAPPSTAGLLPSTGSEVGAALPLGPDSDDDEVGGDGDAHALAGAHVHTASVDEDDDDTEEGEKEEVTGATDVAMVQADDAAGGGSAVTTSDNPDAGTTAPAAVAATAPPGASGSGMLSYLGRAAGSAGKGMTSALSAAGKWMATPPGGPPSTPTAPKTASGDDEGDKASGGGDSRATSPITSPDKDGTGEPTTSVTNTAAAMAVVVGASAASVAAASGSLMKRALVGIGRQVTRTAASAAQALHLAPTATVSVTGADLCAYAALVMKLGDAAGSVEGWLRSALIGTRLEAAMAGAGGAGTDWDGLIDKTSGVGKSCLGWYRAAARQWRREGVEAGLVDVALCLHTCLVTLLLPDACALVTRWVHKQGDHLRRAEA